MIILLMPHSFSRAVEVFNFVEDKMLNDFFYIQMAYTDAKPGMYSAMHLHLYSTYVAHTTA